MTLKEMINNTATINGGIFTIITSSIYDYLDENEDQHDADVMVSFSSDYVAEAFLTDKLLNTKVFAYSARSEISGKTEFIFQIIYPISNKDDDKNER